MLTRVWMVAVVVATMATSSAAANPVEVELELFTRPGCPHCAKAEAFLAQLGTERPGLTVRRYNVRADREALERLRALFKDSDAPTLGVPAIFVRGRLFVGFDDSETTGARIIRWIDGTEEADEDSVELAGLGRVSARELGLPLFTIAVGLIDGFNPCAMWVLLFLLSLLVNLHDRRKMAVVAGTFVVISGLAYFAFMAAWLNFFLLVSLSRGIQIGLGAIALAVAAIHIKDFFALHKGISLSIPESAKPSIYARARRVLNAENYRGAIAAVITLAVLVNLVELLCTAGLPAIYTAILTEHDLPGWKYYAYLLLYNAAYMFDDAIMVTIAVLTLRKLKLQERGGRWLKLLSGLVMAALALMLLFAPDWLSLGS